MNLSRRNLIKYGLMGAGSCFLPMPSFGARSGDDHFLYALFLDGGADFTYLFDARPLEMTTNNLLSNHIGEEPYPWIGANGVGTLASALTRPLEKYKNELAIVNGAFMHSTFIGHDQLLNLLYSGNPFGGNSFVPWINTFGGGVNQAPLDGIKKGESPSAFAINPYHSTLVELEGRDAKGLVDRLKIDPNLSQSTDARNYIFSRFSHIMNKGHGHLSLGAKKLLKEAKNGQELSNKLANLDLSSLEQDEDLKFLDLFSRMAKKKMIRSSLETTKIFDFETNQGGLFPFDTHAIVSGSEHRAMYSRTVDKIEKTIKFFKETPYDSNRSMLDVTTVLVATEFGRTMRQNNVSIEESGTDHNPFSNSFILAGKGIRGNTVIGESDFKTSTEQLSPAHLQLDPQKLHIMGQPFDYNTEKTIQVPMQEFNADNYLDGGSVINTLFDIFSMPENLYRRKNQGSKPYPSLKGIKI